MNTDKKEARTRIPLRWIYPCSSAFICGQTCAARGTAQRAEPWSKDQGLASPAICHLARNEHSPQCLRLRDEENVAGFAKVPLAGWRSGPTKRGPLSRRINAGLVIPDQIGNETQKGILLGRHIVLSLFHERLHNRNRPVPFLIGRNDTRRRFRQQTPVPLHIETSR